MRRETQNVLLVLVGGALIKIVVDGTFLRYVRPWSGPAVLAAGLAIVALATAAIVRDVRGSGTTADDVAAAPGPGEVAGVPEPDDGAHDHDHGSSPSVWLLLLPVLAILLVAPPALGSGALTSAGARSVAVDGAADTRETDPLPPGDAPALGVVDFVSRAASDPRGPLTARDVTLTGFLAAPSATTPSGTPSPPPTGAPDLGRLVISCCAADAAAVRVHLDDPREQVGAEPADGGADRWVQVRGRLVAGTGTAADGHVPTLRVAEVTPVRAPEPVYEY